MAFLGMKISFGTCLWPHSAAILLPIGGFWRS